MPNNKILDQTILKALADNKSNLTKMIISVLERVGKGEIAQLDKQFLLFPECFQKASLPDPSKGQYHCVGMHGLTKQEYKLKVENTLSQFLAREVLLVTEPNFIKEQ